MDEIQCFSEAKSVRQFIVGTNCQNFETVCRANLPSGTNMYLSTAGFSGNDCVVFVPNVQSPSCFNFARAGFRP
jgi:hypothetical protein